MPSLTAPLRPAGRVIAARRLAAGFPVAAVAQAAGRTIDVVEDLLKDDEFQRLVGSWDEIFSLSPELRTRRLFRLAHWVLETALGQGHARTALLLAALERARLDPVVELAEDLRKLGARELRRAERLRAQAAAQAACSATSKAEPAAVPKAPLAEPPEAQPAAEREPDRPPPDPQEAAQRLVDGVCARQRARLRDAMVREQAWSAPLPAMADLQAEAAAVRAAQAEAAGTEAAGTTPADPAGQAATPEPPPTRQSEEELDEKFAEEFAQLPAETQAMLMTFSPEDMERLFKELLRIELERLAHAAAEAEAAEAERDDGGGWPSGP